MTRTITIFQQGLTSFAVCRSCNRRFESKFLNLFKVEKQILEKYQLHNCRGVEESMTMREQAKSSLTRAASCLPLNNAN